MNLRITTTQAGDVTRLALSGELDVWTHPKLKAKLVDLLRTASRPQIEIDLTEVLYLDNAGLGALIGGLKRVREAGGDLTVRCENARILRIFEITGLSKLFRVTGARETVAAGK